MHGFAAILLLIGFCVVLPPALRSVVNDLMQRIGQHRPVSHSPEPAIHDPDSNSARARFQPGERSQSHFRALD
jgi:hypothetical protein